MEKSARGFEAPLLPDRPRAARALITPDVPLQERVRSLLLSRNKRHPPTTPCPSPDYRYLSLHPPQAAIGNSLAPPRTHSSKPTRIGTKQGALESLSQVMGATRFDGPAAQLMEGNASQTRRRSTDVKMPSDRTSLAEGRRNSNVPGIDHNSQGDLIGTRLAASDALNRVKPSGPKRPVQRQMPRISYNLRTVPPKKHQQADQQMSPDGPISPSYCSEVDSELKSLLSDDQLSVSHAHHGPSVSAVNALHHIQGHDPRPVPHAVAEAPHLIENKNSASNPRTSEQNSAEPVIGDEVAGVKELDLKSSEFQNAEELTKVRPLPIRDPSLLSLQSVPLSSEEDVQTPETSLLPDCSPEKDIATEKPSPAGRTLSVLSNMSSNSGLRSLQRAPTPRDEHYPMSNVDEHHILDHSNPSAKGAGTHWNRQIFERQSNSSLGPPNLTARPPRRKKIGVEVSRTPRINTETTDEASVVRRQEQAKESFQRVIGDLESLLKEALHIAGRASREHSESDGPLPQNVGDGYRQLSIADSDGRSSISMDSDQDGAPPGHITLVEPDGKDLYHGHFKKVRDATPFPRSLAMTRQPSIEPSSEVDDEKTEHEKLENETHRAPLPVSTQRAEDFDSVDWAQVKRSGSSLLKPPRVPPTLQVPGKEQQNYLIRDHSQTSKTSGNINASRRQPPVQSRGSSLLLRQQSARKHPQRPRPHVKSSEESISTSGPYVADFRNTAISYHPVYREVAADKPSDTEEGPGAAVGFIEDKFSAPPQPETRGPVQGHSHPTRDEIKKGYSLKGISHFEIREPHGFSLSRSHRRAPIARDWGTSRKRFVASITCLNTALVGLIIGIYAGEVPAIQYALADDHHIVILGNVVFFLGLAITTALFWPLPLLHGRRPYTTVALTLLLLLLFPQALAVNGSRNPYVATYRIGLLVPRAFAGLVMGFANINFKATLLDLFGASLQSGNPHQEIVNEYDVRRHGGGMGVWLGIWTWCSFGSIGVGFWIGASIISGLQVSWGFWILIILTAAVLILNGLTPETRRSAYRRSMAEVRDGTEISRRIARGEIKMHLDSTGPIWWWEEVWAGHVLCIRMFKQPGFTILALYIGWIYGQVVLVIVLLGALLSKYYFLHPQYVGLSIAIIPLGALLATPFQKASLFSRSRHHKQRTDSMTFEKRVSWTSHLVRRAIFMVILPFAGLAYTLASHGPPTPFMVPVVFAGIIGFLSNLAIAECNGIIMETFDTSDLQPGMTGRPRNVLPEEVRRKRTNFSCFPRVTAGFANVHAISFCIAAAVTGWGGVVERRLGAQTATAVMAGVLLVLTLLLIGVLTRYKTIQIIPSQRFGTNLLSGPEDEWKPIIIGNPSGTTRRISILELGSLSRWMEIRRRNRLNSENRGK